MKNLFYLLFFSFWMFSSCNPSSNQGGLSSGPRRVEILFLGHDSEHHHSEKLMPMLAMPLFQKGINLSYTSDLNDLSKETLEKYDGLMIYANHDEILPAQEAAIKEFVESGKALIPLHSASWSFRNSDWFIEAVGGQFKSHGTGDFTVDIVHEDHPVMEGITEFETWDETYVHSNLNEDMTVLMERVDGDHREPWTWIREQGKGRVFYTAYGHDERTWSKPEFHELVANGVLWAVGDKVAQQLVDYDIPVPTFEDADIPNYEKRDPAPRFQHALSPEESMKLIQVPVDFELELFASEPDVINPVTMAWDERGRLFVVETIDYPNEVRKEGTGKDRIKILEDTDGDGKADKFTIFADSLNIPSSMVFVNGGLIISMAPNFVFLKDTDGDDWADIREVIMTGWSQSDTHAGPSNLKYALDNKIWGVMGYAGFNGEVSGKPISFSQGIYRFDPDGENLEYLGRTSNNTWGLGFTEEFDVFISTANGQHSAYLAMPNQYLKRPLTGGSGNAVHGIDSHYDMPHVTPYLRQVDWHGGYTAAAGHNFYTAREFPKSYWNKVAFVAEPTGRVLHNAVIEQEGSGFKEKNGFNILSSSDEWFAPVHAEVGPDGALWIADWYNFIIQHNPTPKGFENGEGNAYINPLRDSKHGRIYRISYKGAKKNKPFSMDKSKGAGLLEGLKSDNMFWRTTAQRLIVETQNTGLLEDLYEIIEDQSVDEIELNSPAVHALWTIHGLGVLDGSNKEAMEVVTEALSHPAVGVRKNALKVLPANQASLEAIMASGVIQDEDLNLRKTALLAVSNMPSSDLLGQQLLEASKNKENASDPYLPQAVFAAVLGHPNTFMEEASSNPNPDKPDSLLSLTERVIKSLMEEQYPLDRRSPILFPPDVSGKEITINASISKASEELEGVIAAQGGKENGYSLFIQDNALIWLVKQGGKAYQIKSPRNLPAEQFTVQAKLMEDGAMNLDINGKSIGKSKAISLFTSPLSPERVRVGNDNEGGNIVGEYSENFWFRGRMGNDSQLSLRDPSVADMATSHTQGGNADQSPSAVGSVVVKIGVIPHEMKFDKESFTVKAGQQVTVDFENQDFMQHNLVVIKSGMLETVGNAADELARDPKGAEQNFIPKIPEVIIATRLVNPEGSETLVFTAPTTPGDYPFVCTVPGHWRIMNGIMKVEK
ncbi:MAG: PVC-type heme-binding CxxCH protein [Anditalea sp.]